MPPLNRLEETLVNSDSDGKLTGIEVLAFCYLDNTRLKEIKYPREEMGYGCTRCGYIYSSTDPTRIREEGEEYRRSIESTTRFLRKEGVPSQDLEEDQNLLNRASEGDTQKPIN